jgi:hypothetical protein
MGLGPSPAANAPQTAHLCIPNLRNEALGGQAGDDVLALLVADYQQHGGQLSLVLKRPEVGAQFSNWHS